MLYKVLHLKVLNHKTLNSYGVVDEVVDEAVDEFVDKVMGESVNEVVGEFVNKFVEKVVDEYARHCTYMYRTHLICDLSHLQTSLVKDG